MLWLMGTCVVVFVGVQLYDRHQERRLRWALAEQMADDVLANMEAEREVLLPYIPEGLAADAWSLLDAEPVNVDIEEMWHRVSLIDQDDPEWCPW